MGAPGRGQSKDEGPGGTTWRTKELQGPLAGQVGRGEWERQGCPLGHPEGLRFHSDQDRSQDVPAREGPESGFKYLLGSTWRGGGMGHPGGGHHRGQGGDGAGPGQRPGRWDMGWMTVCTTGAKWVEQKKKKSAHGIWLYFVWFPFSPYKTNVSQNPRTPFTSIGQV